MDGFDRYLTGEQAALATLAGSKAEILELVEALVSAHAARRWVFVFGNGGSAATAAHAVADLTKFCGIRSLCLSDNTPQFTAQANDASYEETFAAQLRRYGAPGDLAIAISCSGTSPNVLAGVRVAQEIGVRTYGLCGFDGGTLAGLANDAVIVPADRIQHVEDVHHALLHLTSVLVAERISKSSAEGTDVRRARA